MPATHTIAIAAGGTGGHRQIGLAIAEALQQQSPAVRCLLLTSDSNSRWQADPGPDIKTITIASRPFTGQRLSTRLQSVWQLLRGMITARRLLQKHRVQLVVGVGGYASAAAVLSAWSLRRPSLLHEANAIPGRANALLARFSNRICVSWQQLLLRFHDAKVTGTPLRAAREQAAADAAMVVPAPLLLFVGGSLGADFLNRHGPEIASLLVTQVPGLRVLHQCGEHPSDPIQRSYAAAGVEADVEPFLAQPTQALAQARAAVSAAGATTLAELAAFGLPAIIVPLHHSADDHQRANAVAFGSLSQCPWIDSNGWSSTRAADTLLPLLTDDRAWRQASARCHRAHTPNAAKEVAAAALTLLDEDKP